MPVNLGHAAKCRNSSDLSLDDKNSNNSVNGVELLSLYTVYIFIYISK